VLLDLIKEANDALTATSKNTTSAATSMEPLVEERRVPPCQQPHSQAPRNAVGVAKKEEHVDRVADLELTTITAKIKISSKSNLAPIGP
jgi:hypothetical protein